MKRPASDHPRFTPTSRLAMGAITASLLSLPTAAHASLFKGEALDTAANVMSWVVLVIVPVIGISVFWLVHILPEKIAEKKHHPQAKAIQVLCVLSLFFGGMLWPLAWLWAYSKPVLHKLAYGTDKEIPEHERELVAVIEDDERELAQLRQRVLELEARVVDRSSAEPGRI